MKCVNLSDSIILTTPKCKGRYDRQFLMDHLFRLAITRRIGIHKPTKPFIDAIGFPAPRVDPESFVFRHMYDEFLHYIPSPFPRFTQALIQNVLLINELIEEQPITTHFEKKP